MTEVPPPSPEESNKSPKSRLFGKADAQKEPKEPSEGFWDLDDGQGNVKGQSNQPQPRPRAPFMKGDEPNLEQEPSDSHSSAEPREVNGNGQDLVQRIKNTGSKLRKASEFGNSLATVPSDFDSLDGDVFEKAASLDEPAPGRESMRKGSESKALEDSPESEPSAVSETAESKSAPTEQDQASADDLGDAAKPVAAKFEPSRSFAEWVQCVRGFSLIEKACLLVVVVLLSGFAAIMFFPSISRLPNESERADVGDFPKQGEYLRVEAAVTYWREPIVEGPDADVFSRGSLLLPVIEMKVDSTSKVTGSSAIRIIFRGEDGAVVGDTITREVNGAELLKIAGTAGFRDPGMHAAYRTGHTDPWTVQVYEAGSPDAEIEDFKLLFEMNLSSLLH